MNQFFAFPDGVPGTEQVSGDFGIMVMNQWIGADGQKYGYSLGGSP